MHEATLVNCNYPKFLPPLTPIPFLELLSGLLSSVSIFPPNTRPVYSSISFTLLGYVLEEVTGKTFGEIIDTETIQPLGMENTGLQPKTKTSGVIPPVVNVWGADFQDNIRKVAFS